MLSTTEAAGRLGVSERTIRNWINEGRLKASQKDPGKPGSPFLVPRSEVHRILEDRKRQLDK